MKLRSQLVLAFFILAILPLSGLVFYSFHTSQRAFRQAVEAEAAEVAEALSRRMGAEKEILNRRLKDLGRLPFDMLFTAPEANQPRPGREMYAGLLEEIQKEAEVFDSIEFFPTPPEAEIAETPDAEKGAAPLPKAVISSSGGDNSFIIRMDEIRSRRKARKRPKSPELPGSQKLTVEPRPEDEEAFEVDEFEVTMTQLEDAIESARAKVYMAPPGAISEAEQAAMEDAFRAGKKAIAKGKEENESNIQQLFALQAKKHLKKKELQALKRREEMTRRIVGESLNIPVHQGQKIVGYAKAQLGITQILQGVLTKNHRRQGEIPFAYDDKGTLFVGEQGDRAKLEKLGFGEGASQIQAVDWIIEKKFDEDTGLTFGVARPIGEALQGIRRTAVTNFLFGSVMIGMALLGLLLFTGTITRNLALLTGAAEKFADGDLSARVNVQSKNEFGKLAKIFNRMGAELSQNQKRLIEEERRRKEQEIGKRLLEAENLRKSLELDEARQFQISLLPKNLPDQSELDIAVYMKTANEVGGDYYDFHVAEDGALTVAIGDATGHGAKAGIMVTVIKSLFTSLVGTSELYQFLERANLTIKRMNLGRMHMSLSLLRIRGNKATIATAGMPPILIYRTAKDEIDEIDLAGMPLGGISNFDYQEFDTTIDAGDAILLASDGFSELLNSQGEAVGYSRAQSIFAAAANKSANRIIDDITAACQQWAAEIPLRDDVTFVAIKKQAGGVEAKI